MSQKKYEEACINGNIETVIKLFNKIDYKHDKFLGFVNACKYGHLNIVKYHVDKIKNFNVHVNKDEPFVLACWNNHLNVISFLYSLEPKKFNNIIKSGIPLDCFVYNTITTKLPEKTIKWILDNFGPHSNNKLVTNKIIANKLLFRCAEVGNHILFVKTLEKYNIDLNKCKSDISIINVICRNYRINTLKYLLEKYKKKINWKNNWGINFLISEYNNDNKNKTVKNMLDLLIKHKIIDKI